MQERMSQNVEAMTKSIEDNYARKFTILEKQYQEKMQRQKEEYEEKIKQEQEKYQMTLQTMRDKLNAKLSESDAAQLLMKQLNEEKEKGAQRELLLKTQSNDKIKNMQQDFQIHLKKLEAQIKEKDKSIEEKDDTIEKLRNDIADMEVQMESMSVNSALNDNIDVLASAKSIDSMYSHGTLDSRASTRSVDSGQSNPDPAVDLDTIQRRVEQRFIRRMAQQKLTLDKAWGQEVEKLKGQLEQSESNNSVMKQRVLDLEAQLNDHTHDEEVQAQLNELQNRLTEMEQESDILKSEKMKLTVENDFLQKAINAKIGLKYFWITPLALVAREFIILVVHLVSLYLISEIFIF